MRDQRDDKGKGFTYNKENAKDDWSFYLGETRGREMVMCHRKKDGFFERWGVSSKGSIQLFTSGNFFTDIYTHLQN